MDTAWSLPDRPMSVKEISDEANKFIYNVNIPLKHWLRAADSLLKQGNNYVRDGNLSQAYLILLRYSTLVLEHLPRHPDAKKVEGKRALKPLNHQLEPVLETLQVLRPQLNAAHEEWLKIAASQRDLAPGVEGERSPYEKLAARDAALSWNPKARAKLLDAEDNQDLAVDLAKQEIRRRDADRKATRQAGISAEEEQVRRGAGVWENWDVPAPRRRRDDADDLRRNMDAARRRLDQSERAKRPPIGWATHTTGALFNHQPARPNRQTTSPHPPYRSDSAPPRPDKEPAYAPYQTPSSTDAVSGPDRPPKRVSKERYTFRPAAYLENGTPIRPIFLPAGLREEFLKYAAPNTRQGLEMCGILCGTSVNNALFISHLVIPKQTCTSDTCETDNEEEVMEFCEREDVMVFGWIHTHPTQTCFMSSRDLHTQSGYQIMMPESIAIVCAPRSEPAYGIFRLTNGPGLDYILNCTQASTFHQHAIDNLYTDARHPPGHVYHSNQLDFRTEDLRSSRLK
ncbi:hypothetical protein N0V93_007869 [Gnomoniopsis smithogilvyi]|uniref:MPN domain-containing protein n=1 Tax=Gnomoniopsis smithogilvyi TaxID=1191159 RepID=A0A9W8YNY9_9PEZI|nr:hypothetical protein N0V93_007869 [Gnomoniopsis smithogilvyi]